MTDENQCRATTRNGDRCSRPARDDGFCYQHGPDDRTVEERASAPEPGPEAVARDGGGESAVEDSAQSESDSDPNDADRSAKGDLSEVRKVVSDITGDLVGRPMDNVVGIDRENDQWVAAVEVIERRAVPDTQDILARYEITLDDSISPTGYHRTDRYRRDDMDQDI